MALDAKTYMAIFVGALILSSLVSATGSTLLSNLVSLNGTFASTGIGNIFSATILGLLFGVFVFWAFYKMFS